MTLSKSSKSSSKKSTSASKSHSAANPEATVASAATVALSPQDPAPSTPSSTTAAKVIAQLDALEASLNLDIVVRPNDKSQNRALGRVSDTALSLASDIVSSAPSRFPDFAGLPAATKHVQEMTPVVARASELAAHLQNSVQNVRTPAAQQTLVLYAVVKGLGRMVDNQTMREKVSQLKAEVAPKHKTPKPKKTKTQKAVERAAKSQANKVQKAQKVLAQAGVSVAPPTPSVTGTPPVTSPSLAVQPAVVAPVTSATPVAIPAPTVAPSATSAAN